MSEAFEGHAAQPIMEMSANIAAIAKVLPQAQAAMGEVFKNANNPAFRSKYADLAAVVEAVVPALNANGISLLQPASFDGHQVNVSTMLLHESGEWVRCTLSSPIAKRDAQGIGSACTYLRRYGLQAMSGVAPEDDDGNAASQKGDTKPAEPSAIFTACKAAIDVCDDQGALDDWKVKNAAALNKMAPADLADVREYWQRRAKAVQRAQAAIPPKPDLGLNGDDVPTFN